jgi:hypothetical protein
MQALYFRSYLAIVFSSYLWQKQIWICLLLIVILLGTRSRERHGESLSWWIWCWCLSLRSKCQQRALATSYGSSPVVHVECGPVGSSLDLVEEAGRAGMLRWEQWRPLYSSLSKTREKWWWNAAAFLDFSSLVLHQPCTKAVLSCLEPQQQINRDQ